MTTAFKFLCAVSRKLAVLVLAAGLTWAYTVTAEAAEYALVANTKLKVTAFQLNPTKGEYALWPALSGDFTVSQGATVTLPLLGPIDVSNQTVAGLGEEIRQLLQSKLNLIAPTDVTVEVVEYPPIYVAGAVSQPGEYKFRPGMTALQALSLSGGLFRPQIALAGPDSLGTASELQGLKLAIVRNKARIGRLRAEVAGADEISFPPELADADDTFTLTVLEQERSLFAARKSALQRQLRTLTNLRDAYTAEQEALEKKVVFSREAIEKTKAELQRVASLVEKGVLTISRKTEIEIQLASLQSAQLDLDLISLRTRQNLAETVRNVDALQDDMATNSAAQLQDAEAVRDQLQIKEQLLKSSGGDIGTDGSGRSVLYKISRTGETGLQDIDATESAFLLPGDVLTIGVMQVPGP